MTECIIEKLIKYKFSLRSYQEKLEIVRKGRMCPKLPNMITKHKSKNKEYTRHFCQKQYEVFSWLTGCENLNRLFCWPCLLFSDDNVN